MKKIALEEAVIIPGQEDVVPEHAIHPEFRDNSPSRSILPAVGSRIWMRTRLR